MLIHLWVSVMDLNNCIICLRFINFLLKMRMLFIFYGKSIYGNGTNPIKVFRRNPGIPGPFFQQEIYRQGFTLHERILRKKQLVLSHLKHNARELLIGVGLSGR